MKNAKWSIQILILQLSLNHTQNCCSVRCTVLLLPVVGRSEIFSLNSEHMNIVESILHYSRGKKYGENIYFHP
jgi:hypothetical protein